MLNIVAIVVMTAPSLLKKEIPLPSKEILIQMNLLSGVIALNEL
jgi:hypothetical protein